MRILVVEDEQQISTFIKRFLHSSCFSVDLAKDGEEGLFLARTNTYALIILDNMLPKKSGYEVCRVLRSEGSEIPIIALSAVHDTETKVSFLNAGADDYLPKPFSCEELLARINALLRRPKVIQSEILTYKDIVVDTRKNKVTKAGKEIVLTRKEIMLLKYLMQRSGTALSRSMIMENIWNMEADPFSNTIESHILSLRKKIGDTKNPRTYIHTITGRGYAFSEIPPCNT